MTSARSATARPSTRLTPVDVPGLSSGVIAISAGGSHTCALTSAGGVKCWGRNDSGQLGDGTTTNRSTPVNVSGLTSGVAAISAGGYHTCAITTSSALKCWGRNDRGQLGDNSATNRPQPVNVTGMTSGVTSVSAGGSDAQGGHTCAIATGGALKCWGRNDFGQVGDGSTADRFVPANVSGLASGVISVAEGRYHSCAVLASGGAKCWGWNINGQLGRGDTTSSNTPTDVINLTNATQVSAGAMNTCARTSTGGVKCWGNNSVGQLGDGTSGNTRQAPVNVLASPGGPPLAGVSFMSAGGSITADSHTCAITSTGLKCWGLNVNGQVGDGTTAMRTTPVDVIGFVPPPTATAVPTDTPTATPTNTSAPTSTIPPATPSNTPLPTATGTSIPTASNTPTPSATNTPEPTATPTATATNTPFPTSTSTSVPTATSTPEPTATNTPAPTATNTTQPTATNTPLPTATQTNTATNTPLPTATNTPVPTATNTAAPTATNTAVPTATDTVAPTATNTALPTATPTSTPTNTPLPTATNTPVPTATNTAAPTATNTPLPTATNTPIPTATNTTEPSATNTVLPTASPTDTATNTPLPTATNTPVPTATNTSAPTATNTALPTATPTDTTTNTPPPTATNTPVPTATSTATPTSTPTPALYFALANDGVVGGLTVANEDIVAWDGGSGFVMHFDGSDVGLSGLAIDGYARMSATQLLFSFTAPAVVPGIAGTVDDSDIVMFTAASLGEATAGTFSLYFDGSDVGLTTTDEDIDAIDVLPDGSILISTLGTASVTGVAAGDEDVLRFAPSSTGSTTAGSWSLHFDGSDVGLTATAEDVDAVCVGASGQLRLSTAGAFTVSGASGVDEDVFAFTPSSLGTNTAGVFGPGLLLDGSAYGLSANDVTAVECS